VINFKLGTVFYGDSLGKGISIELQKILDWWIYLHTGQRFSYEWLPITFQRDGYSCGLLAWDALVSFLLKRDALITATKVGGAHLGVLLYVVKQHQEHVGYTTNHSE
jgi:hypothetical protein